MSLGALEHTEVAVNVISREDNGVCLEDEEPMSENLPQQVGMRYMLLQKLRNIPDTYETSAFLPLPNLSQLPGPSQIKAIEKLHTEIQPYVPDHLLMIDQPEQFPLSTKYKKNSRPFASGHYGEVWLAHLMGDEIPTDVFSAKFVMKRIFHSEKKEYLLSGKREEYFGLMFQGKPHIARFIESFEEADGTFWIVYRNEGMSLHQVLYRTRKSQMMEVTDKWKWMRTTASQKLHKHIIKALLMALKSVHLNEVIHRDVKPSNILVGRRGFENVTLCDFGSSVDLKNENKFYESGPTQGELTLDYAPPEILFSKKPFDEEYPFSYDLWSVGVVFLEMILGTTLVFEIDSRTRAIMESRLFKKSKQFKQRAFFLQALSEYCFYIPIEDDDCPLEKTMKAIERRDVLKIGVKDKWALLFLKKLLAYDPGERLSADVLLTHAYFTGGD